MKNLLFLLILSYLPNLVKAQKIQYELAVGVNYSTINNIRFDQQVVLAFRENAPGYKIYPQFGILGRKQLNSRLNFQFGIKVQRKGDLLGSNNLLPVDTIFSSYLDYFTLPLNIEVRLLSQKNVYWVAGLSGSIFFRSSPIPTLSKPFVENVSDRLELAMQTGIRMDLNKRFALQILVSKGLTNTNKVDQINYRFQNMLAEGTLIYRINFKP